MKRAAVHTLLNLKDFYRTQNKIARDRFFIIADFLQNEDNDEAFEYYQAQENQLSDLRAQNFIYIQQIDLALHNAAQENHAVDHYIAEYNVEKKLREGSKAQ